VFGQQEKSDAVWTNVNMSVQASIENDSQVDASDLKLSSISCLAANVC
jgi:hypothetical protein